jgi:hypothetical protein
MAASSLTLHVLRGLFWLESREITNVARKLSSWWAIFIICLAAFIIITLLSDQIFERVPHSEDEVAYLFQAKVFAQNRLAVPTPPLPDAFWTPFVVDHEGQRFSNKYPIGWSLLLSLGVRLGAPWLINTLLGSLTLALIAWLGDCFYCRNRPTSPCYIPIGAAVLGLVTPGFLFLSSSLLSHAASLFWSTLTLLTLFYLTSPIEVSNKARRRAVYAVGVGLFLGAVFMTRPFAACALGLVVGIYLLLLVLQREVRWPVLLWVGLGSLGPILIVMLYWRLVAGDPLFNPYLLVWPYDRPGFGPDVGPYGYFLSDGIFINTRLKLIALATGLFGWPGWTNIIFLPLPFLAGRPNRQDWLLLGTILSIIVIYIFYWSFGGTDGGFPRYYYDALPAFVLLTARGIEVATQMLERWRPYLRWLPIGLVTILVGYNLFWNLPGRLANQKGKYDITPAPLEIVARARLSEPALILVKDYESWTDFAVPFTANSPTLDGPVVFAIDWGARYNQQLRALFAGRACWELRGEALQRCPE